MALAWRRIGFPNGGSLLSATCNSIPGFAQFSTKSSKFPTKTNKFSTPHVKGLVQRNTKKMVSEFGDLNDRLLGRVLDLKNVCVGSQKSVRLRKRMLKYAERVNAK